MVWTFSPQGLHCIWKTWRIRHSWVLLSAAAKCAIPVSIVITNDEFLRMHIISLRLNCPAREYTFFAPALANEHKTSEFSISFFEPVIKIQSKSSFIFYISFAHRSFGHCFKPARKPPLHA